MEQHRTIAGYSFSALAFLLVLPLLLLGYVTAGFFLLGAAVFVFVPRYVTGSVLCTAQTADGTATNVRYPIVIFDAWHRAAAWIMQSRRGEAYPITGFLVVTEHRVPLLGEE